MMSKLASLALVAALAGCSSDPSSGRGPAGDSADGGAIGATLADAGSDGAPSTSPANVGETFAGRYEVPVPPALAAAATYPIAAITWRVVGGVATLEYDLPLALVGLPVRVHFEGPFDAVSQTASMTGVPGTAQCTVTGADVACHETMRGLLPLAVDLAVVQSLATDYAGPASDRVSVTKLFSTDPIGIAHVALDTPVAPVDDHGGGRRTGS